MTDYVLIYKGTRMNKQTRVFDGVAKNGNACFQAFNGRSRFNISPKLVEHVSGNVYKLKAEKLKSDYDAKMVSIMFNRVLNWTEEFK